MIFLNIIVILIDVRTVYYTFLSGSMLEDYDSSSIHFMKSLSSQQWLNGKDTSTHSITNQFPSDNELSKSYNKSSGQL